MPVSNALPGYYTTKEAAEKLGYANPTSLTNMCLSGKVSAFKVGKTWLIPESVIDELDRREVKPQGNRGIARK